MSSRHSTAMAAFAGAQHDHRALAGGQDRQGGSERVPGAELGLGVGRSRHSR
ncbi:hypothetical protein [Nonomuraea sp. NPDC050540]|uniref:hypothetical protein n=1 Tax=Nonomuraea sp. NPDC050540 TaxID=3364367 RepID=UPI003789824A